MSTRPHHTRPLHILTVIMNASVFYKYRFEYNRAKVMEIVNEIEVRYVYKIILYYTVSTSVSIVYNLLCVMQCELVAIARGRAESHRHSVFVSGSEKERNGLKREGHYGPIMKWKSGKVAIRRILSEIL